MWKYNNDLNKWYSTEDVLPQADFDYTTQELSATRYYSKCLSGASYIPVNSLDDQAGSRFVNSLVVDSVYSCCPVMLTKSPIT